MQESPRVSFRLPQKLLTALEKRAGKAGKKLSRFLVERLAADCELDIAPLAAPFAQSSDLARKAQRKSVKSRLDSEGEK